jgi:hypothetical protein
VADVTSTFASSSEGWVSVMLAYPQPSAPPTPLGNSPFTPNYGTFGSPSEKGVSLVDPDGNDANGNTQYWSAPAKFLGNQVTAYGGSMAYDLIDTNVGFGPFAEEDAILVGGGLTLVYVSLQPSFLDAGSAAFALTVNGSEFLSGDTVEWNGVPLTTTYVSSSKLTAKVSAAEVADAGSAAVTVVNTATGNQTSDTALFAIPLTSLAISSQSIKTSGGGYLITLTLQNTGFKAATNISLTGAYLATSETSTHFLSKSHRLPPVAPSR